MPRCQMFGTWIALPLTTGTSSTCCTGPATRCCSSTARESRMRLLPLMNRPPLARLQQIHYRRRGYGQSTAAGGPPESFMARAAADAAQLLAHLRVDAAHVVGHSSGALLGVPSTGPHMAALTPAVQRYAAGDRAGAIDGLFSVVFGPGWRPHADLAVPGGAEQAEAEAATFFESELPGVGAWQFDARRAAQVRQPVLFMMGSATVPFHKETGERIREWWPESERYRSSRRNSCFADRRA